MKISCNRTLSVIFSFVKIFLQNKTKIKRNKFASVTVYFSNVLKFKFFLDYRFFSPTYFFSSIQYIIYHAVCYIFHQHKITRSAVPNQVDKLLGIIIAGFAR